jgi:hypothetical protein
MSDIVEGGNCEGGDWRPLGDHSDFAIEFSDVRVVMYPPVLVEDLERFSHDCYISHPRSGWGMLYVSNEL